MIERFLRTKPGGWIGLIYCVVIYPLFLFTFITAAYNELYIHVIPGHIWLVSGIALFGVPLVLSALFTSTLDYRRIFPKLCLLVFWSVYTVTVIAAAGCAIMWFYNPDNGRWEPITVILTFVAAWTTYVQRQRHIPDMSLFSASADSNEQA